MSFMTYSDTVLLEKGSLDTPRRAAPRCKSCKIWIIKAPDGELLTIRDFPQWCIDNDFNYRSFSTAISRGYTYKGYMQVRSYYGKDTS
jgi:hypothetical protein